jgi:hypothetical protein
MSLKKGFILGKGWSWYFQRLAFFDVAFFPNEQGGKRKEIIGW